MSPTSEPCSVPGRCGRASFASDSRRWTSPLIRATDQRARDLAGLNKDRKPENRLRRKDLARSLLGATRGWLTVESGEVAACIEPDNALDAVVAAPIARAAAVGLVVPVPDADRVAARREGWIAIPLAGSLPVLPAGIAERRTLWGGRSSTHPMDGLASALE